MPGSGRSPSWPRSDGLSLTDWSARADASYRVLVERFWDARHGLFRVSSAARPAREHWHYWWQAQALLCVLDAVARGDAGESARAERLVAGVIARNGGSLRNDYHDDLAWMGLALEQAREVAGLPTGPLVAGVWADIQAGWHPQGGIAWRRGDTYVNASANGPAALLAARVGDLDWARRILGWLDATLVEHGSGVVWDGIHHGDPAPHRERYSYHQGTVAAAYAEVGEPAWRDRALLVARAGLPAGGVLPDEGGGDRALFKGMYARCVAGLGDPGLLAGLARCGQAAWAARRGGLHGPSWTEPPGRVVELSAHLSGVLLLGALAGGYRLDRAG